MFPIETYFIKLAEIGVFRFAAIGGKIYLAFFFIDVKQLCYYPIAFGNLVFYFPG